MSKDSSSAVGLSLELKMDLSNRCCNKCGKDITNEINKAELTNIDIKTWEVDHSVIVGSVTVALCETCSQTFKPKEMYLGTIYYDEKT